MKASELLDRTWTTSTTSAKPGASHQIQLAMLAELGFGLDLESCAATGETTELIYVSPKSGGAGRGRPEKPGATAVAAAAVPARAGTDERLVRPGPAGWFELTGSFLLRRAGAAQRAIPTPATALSMR
jgi:DNA repair protein RecO (recombination protein O)